MTNYWWSLQTKKTLLSKYAWNEGSGGPGNWIFSGASVIIKPWWFQMARLVGDPKLNNIVTYDILIIYIYILDIL